MPTYTAPVRDSRFVLEQVIGLPELAGTPGFDDFDADMIAPILEEAGRFFAEVVAPTNHPADQEGCTRHEDGSVTTPSGFKEMYQQVREAGWNTLALPVDRGGQGMPGVLNFAVEEYLTSANMAFGMYFGLTAGAIEAIEARASQELRDLYVPKMASGEWSGTMNLTEPHAGTDLGLLRTRAEPNGDGSWSITGTKIFISSGEHDLTSNIVHLVLARTPDAPKGTKGISMFIVPKVLVEADGTLGARNPVHCASIEHKMGIRASATAVLNFDGATGYMIGEPNKGLEAMFTFMNTARIGTAVQGVCHAELSFQGALRYARDRRSMRALRGKQEPDKVADSIIHHADVRRMLLTQKAVAEGGRAMVYFAAQYADHMVNGILEGDEKKYRHWDDKLGFFTPILKGFLTELGLEASNLGMQVFGGHGYIKEHGMEQIARDARIATLYEGTTGIQALDLLGRKVLLGTRGKVVREFTTQIAKFAMEHMGNARLRGYATTLARYAAEWNVLTMRVMLMARKDREVVSAASHHFLMYSGYVMMAYFWAIQAAVASKRLAEGGAEPPAFYKAKLATARFYFDHLLPRAKGHAASMVKPSKSLTKLPVEDFAFE